MILEIKYKDIVLNYILKKSSNKNLDNFLSKIPKLLDKKNQFINISKQKSNIGKLKPKIVIINSFYKLDKGVLSILIFTLIYDIGIINIAMIDADYYYLTCKLKRTQVFVIFMRSLEF